MNKSAFCSVTVPDLAVTVVSSEGSITDDPARLSIWFIGVFASLPKTTKVEEEAEFNTDVPALLNTELIILFEVLPNIVNVLEVEPEPAGPAGPCGPVSP